MKKKILSFPLTGFIIVTGFAAFCQHLFPTTTTTTTTAKQIVEADYDKNRRFTEIDSASDFQIFKKAADRQVSENIKKLSALQAKKSFDSKAVKQLFFKKITALRNRNNELKDRIKGYTATETSKWSSFKREYIYDMDQLEDDIRAIN